MKVYFTRQAEDSLNDIVLFIAENNPEYAITFVQGLVQSVTLSLENMPYIGTPYTDDTRYLVKKKYVFVYTVNHASIEILDVFRPGKNWKI